MIKPVIALVSIAFLGLGSPLLAAPHGGGGQAGPPGGGAGPGYAPVRPVWGGGYHGGARPGYGAYPGYGVWRGGYWGPRVGYYYGGPGYWGVWPGYWGVWPGAWGVWGVPYAYGYSVAPAYAYDATPTEQFIPQEPAAVVSPPVKAEASYWYYCIQPAGYFPYVKDCSQAWLKVVPQAPGQTSTAPRVAP